VINIDNLLSTTEINYCNLTPGGGKTAFSRHTGQVKLAKKKPGTPGSKHGFFVSLQVGEFGLLISLIHSRQWELDMSIRSMVHKEGGGLTSRSHLWSHLCA